MIRFDMNRDGDISNAGAKMASSKLQSGDMIIHNGILYRYEGDNGSTTGTFVSPETGKRITYAQVSTSLQNADIISDKSILNEKMTNSTGLPDNAIIRGQAKFALEDGKTTAARKYMKRMAIIDIEASRLDSGTGISPASVSQIGWSEVDMRQVASQQAKERFNRKNIGTVDAQATNPAMNNVQIVNDTIVGIDHPSGNHIENVLKKLHEKDRNAYTKMFSDGKATLGGQDIFAGKVTTYEQVMKTSIDSGLFTIDSPEMKQLADAINISGGHTKVIASTANGHTSAGSVGGFMTDVMTNLSNASRSGSVQIGSHTSLDINMIEQMKGTGNLDFHDTRLQGAITLERLFPEAGEAQLDFLSRIKKGVVSKAKALRSAGTNTSLYDEVDVIEKSFTQVVEGVGRGYGKTKYASLTTVEELYNILWEKVKGTGKFTKELHEGSPDATMTNKLMTDIFTRKEDFMREYSHKAREMGMSPREMFVMDAGKYHIRKNLAKLATEYGGENPDAWIAAEYAKLEKMVSPRSETARRTDYGRMYEKITNEEIARSTPMHRKLSEYFGGETIKSMLGGAMLVGGVQLAVDKLQGQYDQVRSLHEKEGMSHTSIQTVMRRLAMTQFGSGFLGRTKTFTTGLFKDIFMTKSSATGINMTKSLSALNESWHSIKDIRPINAIKKIRESIFSFGKGIEGHEIRYSSNPVWQSIGKIAKRFGASKSKPSFFEHLKETNYNIKEFSRKYAESKMGTVSETEAMKINRAYSIFKRRNLNADDAVDVFMFRSRKYIYAGVGSAVGINMLAGSYNPKEHKEERDVKPNDIYTKQAFNSEQYKLTNDMRKSTLSNALSLRDKGIAEGSVSRRIVRNQMTDFGSQKEGFNPTTTQNAESLIYNTRQYINGTRTDNNILKSYESGNLLKSISSRLNESFYNTSLIMDTTEEVRNTAMNEIKQNIRLQHDQLDDNTIAKSISEMSSLTPRFFKDRQNIDIDNYSIPQTESLQRRFTDVKSMTTEKIDRSFLQNDKFTYQGFIGQAGSYNAPEFGPLTNQFRNQYVENNTRLDINSEEHDPNFRTIGYTRNPSSIGLNNASLSGHIAGQIDRPNYPTINNNSNALGGFIRPDIDNIQNRGELITETFDKNYKQPTSYELPKAGNVTSVIGSANFNQSRHSVIASIDMNEYRNGKITSMMPDSTPPSSGGINIPSQELIDNLTINSSGIGHTAEVSNFANDVINNAIGE
jgi:hypothetical protein